MTETSTPGDSWQPSEPPCLHNPSETAVPSSDPVEDPSQPELQDPRDPGLGLQPRPMRRRRRRARDPRGSSSDVRALSLIAALYALRVVGKVALVALRQTCDPEWHELIDMLLAVL